MNIIKDFKKGDGAGSYYSEITARKICVLVKKALVKEGFGKGEVRIMCGRLQSYFASNGIFELWDLDRRVNRHGKGYERTLSETYFCLKDYYNKIKANIEARGTPYILGIL